MYTGTRVQGSGLGAPAASRPTRDAPAWRGELGSPQAPRQGLEAAPERPSRESTEHAGPRFQPSGHLFSPPSEAAAAAAVAAATAKSLQSCPTLCDPIDGLLPGSSVPGSLQARTLDTGAYTLIAPNEKRRNEIQQMAAKELEELERWKEQQRVKSITLPPMTLGGSQSEAEVRRRQQLQLIQSKYQKKLKREECVRIKKEAEEAEVQKMRAAQREKSNKLEEKKRLQENLRRETFREHQQHKTAEFLRRFEADLPHRGACPVAGCDPQSSAWARRQAYMDTLKEEQNQKLQKMKEEQHQQFSRSVVSDSLRPHESQHARPPCPSPSPGVHSDSRPSSL
ncbi:epithelial-stromal interaction protein 1 isoform X3 [Ovis aries]|uniref:epithelial-stromal interaction protein 1 isoform X3 n=1 Tax=Ovis aries TaxID=9940 RepID=UPI00295273F2|nr:epithelial-stromal interaction protein 1 isoform X3 [Ovis aries]